jgi:hypothetical protein
MFVVLDLDKSLDSSGRGNHFRRHFRWSGGATNGPSDQRPFRPTALPRRSPRPASGIDSGLESLWAEPVSDTPKIVGTTSKKQYIGTDDQWDRGLLCNARSYQYKTAAAAPCDASFFYHGVSGGGPPPAQVEGAEDPEARGVCDTGNPSKGRERTSLQSAPGTVSLTQSLA